MSRFYYQKKAKDHEYAMEVTKGGFTNFRRATQTPFNLIYEAKP
jgi:hypothetical protein